VFVVKGSIIGVSQFWYARYFSSVFADTYFDVLTNIPHETTFSQHHCRMWREFLMLQ